MEKQVGSAIEAGRHEHYADALLYDHEYRHRRDDVAYYERVAAKLGAPDEISILELGCGTGRITAPLLRAGYRVVGVDAEPSMLERATERLAKLPAAARARGTLAQADFCDLAIGRRFDLVICPFNAFMHLYDRPSLEAFLDGVKRHLRPGGWFVFDLMMPDLRWLIRRPDKRWARTRFRDPATGVPMIYSTNHFFDEARQICFMKIYYDPQEPGAAPSRVVHLTHRYYFPEELRALLHYNGFTVEKHCRDFEESDYDDLGGGDQQVLWCRVAPSTKRSSAAPRSTSRSTFPAAAVRSTSRSTRSRGGSGRSGPTSGKARR